MIRVLYRWQIEEACREDFARWWRDRTMEIRTSENGALGSTLTRSTSDPATWIGIARWASLEELHQFRTRVGSISFDGAALQSMEVLEEVDHLTIESAGA